MFRGDRLKQIREQMGLSQEAFGALFGLTKVTICGYENGIRIPKLQHFLAMVEELDVTPDYLLGRDIDIIEDEKVSYKIKISKEDLKIIRRLKRYPKLAMRLRTDTDRTLKQADQLMKDRIEQ